MEEAQLESFYYQTTDLWRRFCEEHSELFDHTCDEYTLLLSNDIDALENILEQKKDIIEKIGVLEEVRREIIEEINKKNNTSIESISELIAMMEDVEGEKKGRHLRRFNDLLVDIIEKIQIQNKKNQIFLNKAITSLKEIREDALGVESFPTYDSKGSEALGGFGK